MGTSHGFLPWGSRQRSLSLSLPDPFQVLRLKLVAVSTCEFRLLETQPPNRPLCLFPTKSVLSWFSCPRVFFSSKVLSTDRLPFLSTTEGPFLRFQVEVGRGCVEARRDSFSLQLELQVKTLTLPRRKRSPSLPRLPVILQTRVPTPREKTERSGFTIHLAPPERRTYERTGRTGTGGGRLVPPCT